MQPNPILPVEVTLSSIRCAIDNKLPRRANYLAVGIGEANCGPSSEVQERIENIFGSYLKNSARDANEGSELVVPEFVSKVHLNYSEIQEYKLLFLKDTGFKGVNVPTIVNTDDWPIGIPYKDEVNVQSKHYMLSHVLDKPLLGEIRNIYHMHNKLSKTIIVGRNDYIWQPLNEVIRNGCALSLGTRQRFADDLQKRGVFFTFSLRRYLDGSTLVPSPYLFINGDAAPIHAGKLQDFLLKFPPFKYDENREDSQEYVFNDQIRREREKIKYSHDLKCVYDLANVEDDQQEITKLTGSYTGRADNSGSNSDTGSNANATRICGGTSVCTIVPDASISRENTLGELTCVGRTNYILGDGLGGNYIYSIPSEGASTPASVPSILVHPEGRVVTCTFNKNSTKEFRSSKAPLESMIEHSSHASPVVLSFSQQLNGCDCEYMGNDADYPCVCRDCERDDQVDFNVFPQNINLRSNGLCRPSSPQKKVTFKDSNIFYLVDSNYYNKVFSSVCNCYIRQYLRRMLLKIVEDDYYTESVNILLRECTEDSTPGYLNESEMCQTIQGTTHRIMMPDSNQCVSAEAENDVAWGYITPIKLEDGRAVQVSDAHAPMFFESSVICTDLPFWDSLHEQVAVQVPMYRASVKAVLDPLREPRFIYKRPYDTPPALLKDIHHRKSFVDEYKMEHCSPYYHRRQINGPAPYLEGPCSEQETEKYFEEQVLSARGYGPCAVPNVGLMIPKQKLVSTPMPPMPNNWAMPVYIVKRGYDSLRRGSGIVVNPPRAAYKVTPLIYDEDGKIDRECTSRSFLEREGYNVRSVQQNNSPPQELLVTTRNNAKFLVDKSSPPPSLEREGPCPKEKTSQLISLSSRFYDRIHQSDHPIGWYRLVSRATTRCFWNPQVYFNWDMDSAFSLETPPVGVKASSLLMDKRVLPPSNYLGFNLSNNNAIRGL